MSKLGQEGKVSDDWQPIWTRRMESSFLPFLSFIIHYIMNENTKNNEGKKYCRKIVGKKFVNKNFNGHDEDVLKGE